MRVTTKYNSSGKRKMLIVQLIGQGFELPWIKCHRRIIDGSPSNPYGDACSQPIRWRAGILPIEFLFSVKPMSVKTKYRSVGKTHTVQAMGQGFESPWTKCERRITDGSPFPMVTLAPDLFAGGVAFYQLSSSSLSNL